MIMKLANPGGFPIKSQIQDGFQGKIYLAFHLNSHLVICKITLDIGWNSNFYVCIVMYKNWNDEGLLGRGKLFVAISGVIGETKSSL